MIKKYSVLWTIVVLVLVISLSACGSDNNDANEEAEIIEKKYTITQPLFELTDEKIISDITEMATFFGLENVKVEITDTRDGRELYLKGELLNNSIKNEELRHSNDFFVIFGGSQLMNDVLYWYDMRSLPMISQEEDYYCVYVDFDKEATSASQKTAMEYSTSVQTVQEGKEVVQALGSFDVTEKTSAGHILVCKSNDSAKTAKINKMISIAFYSMILQPKN